MVIYRKKYFIQCEFNRIFGIGFSISRAGFNLIIVCFYFGITRKY